MFKLGSWSRPTAPAARSSFGFLNQRDVLELPPTRALSKASSPYPRATTLPSVWHGCCDIWQQGQLAVLVGRWEHQWWKSDLTSSYKHIWYIRHAHFQGWREEGDSCPATYAHFENTPATYSPESLRTIDKHIRSIQNPSKIMSLTDTEN